MYGREERLFALNGELELLSAWQVRWENSLGHAFLAWISMRLTMPQVAEVLAEVRAAGEKLPRTRLTVVQMVGGPGSRARVRIGHLKVRGFDEVKMAELGEGHLDMSIGDAFVKARKANDVAALNGVLMQALSQPEPDFTLARKALNAILKLVPTAIGLFVKTRQLLGM